MKPEGEVKENLEQIEEFEKVRGPDSAPMKEMAEKKMVEKKEVDEKIKKAPEPE